MANNPQLHKLIQEFYKKYDNVDRIYCSALKSYVHFGMEGRRHLLYKSSRQKRPPQEQQYRIKLFPRAIKLLKDENTIANQSVRLKGKNIHRYYYLSSSNLTEPNPIKVIIRIKHNKLEFHSVMHKHRGTKKPRRKRGS